MKTFEFSIIASGIDPEADDFGDRFYDAGCDDALVAFQKGHTIIDFAREAETFAEAIASAVENVCAAGATIDRIEPDPLVNLSDIAVRTNLTRAAISKYAKAKSSKKFPAPIARVTSAEPLWDWSEVATWMVQNKKLPVEVAVAAFVVKEANAAIGRREFHMQKMLTEKAQKEETSLKLLAA
jgi:predicted DNA-binding transcriptional regulator AlpA